MKILMALMLLSLLLPILQSFRSSAIWERMLCFTSISTRAALALMVFSQLRDDALVMLVAVVVLSLGNSGLLLLANLIRGMESECE